MVYSYVYLQQIICSTKYNKISLKWNQQRKERNNRKIKKFWVWRKEREEGGGGSGKLSIEIDLIKLNKKYLTLDLKVRLNEALKMTTSHYFK